MDNLQLMYYLFLIPIFTFLKGMSSFTLTAYQSADKAVLGNNHFTIACTYTLEANDVLFFIDLERKRETDADFITVVVFENPTSELPVTYLDADLQSRTNATKPTGNKTAKLVFNQIVCNDKATYRWSARYTDGTVKTATKIFSFVVKANTLFTQGGRLTFLPNTNIAEGDVVAFTCNGDVGNEPVGKLGWFYYLNNVTSKAVNASSLATSSAPIYQPITCSYTRTSKLELKMTAEFHKVLVRCIVQQDHFNQFGDSHKQTNNIPVYYPPKIISIENKTVEEGLQSLTLTCNADAYPAPVYTWVLPGGTVNVGPYFTLTNIQVRDSGGYTCVVYNTYKGANHTVKETIYIDVRKTTTPAQTASPSTDKERPTKLPATWDHSHHSHNNTAVIVIFCVVVVLLISITVFAVILLVKRRKNRELGIKKSQKQNVYCVSYDHKHSTTDTDNVTCVTENKVRLSVMNSSEMDTT